MSESSNETATKAGRGRKSNNNYYYAITGVVVIVLIVIAAYFVLGNGTGQKVVAGDNVSVYYKGSFTNGTVFGENFNSTPLNFTAGSSEVIPGFSNAVIGMTVGQTKTVTVPPAEGYGEYNASHVIDVPIAEFGNNTVKVNETVTSSSGLQGIVESVNSTDVVVNFNSPLAGKTLVFEIKLLKINK
ncbi:MAG: peptidylprolyl isomerase [Candidatus Marsarchaeota archaeon]|nr:peptidylprolyl isomerase [Candidatus Marsarchaeota archaeon]